MQDIVYKFVEHPRVRTAQYVVRVTTVVVVYMDKDAWSRYACGSDQLFRDFPLVSCHDTETAVYVVFL